MREIVGSNPFRAKKNPMLLLFVAKYSIKEQESRFRLVSAESEHVSELSDMSTRGLVIQEASTINI